MVKFAKILTIVEVLVCTSAGEGSAVGRSAGPSWADVGQVQVGRPSTSPPPMPQAASHLPARLGQAPT